jgi:immunity protein, SdpI family
VPIHWGVDGQPNGYAGKTVGLFLLPAITAGIAALFWIIPIIEPRRTHIEKSGTAYRAMAVGTILLLAAIDLLTVVAALGHDLDVTLIVFVGVGLLFIVIGNYLPKVRSNYLVGIRTPWTLTSERSWDRTHRLGGRLFVLEGIVLVILGLLRPAAGVLLPVLFGGIIVLIVVLFAYSYQVWKTDPARKEA